VPVRRPCPHDDGEPVFEQHASEWRAGELATLVRVEDLRLGVASEGILKSLNAERRLIVTDTATTARDGCRAALRPQRRG
jgi:hypothetical protein